jgi:hypothetical protein
MSRTLGAVAALLRRFVPTGATVLLLVLSSLAGERIGLVRIGTTSSNGNSMPLWALQIGNTSAAEYAASIQGDHSRYLGPNALDGVIWIRAGENPKRWVRVIYIRPHSLNEFLDFVDQPACFRARNMGGREILPLPFSLLPPPELAKLDYIVLYFQGGVKAYLLSGTSENEAFRFLTSYRSAESLYENPDAFSSPLPWFDGDISQK